MLLGGEKNNRDMGIFEKKGFCGANLEGVLLGALANVASSDTRNCTQCEIGGKLFK